MEEEIQLLSTRAAKGEEAYTRVRTPGSAATPENSSVVYLLGQNPKTTNVNIAGPSFQPWLLNSAGTFGDPRFGEIGSGLFTFAARGYYLLSLHLVLEGTGTAGCIVKAWPYQNSSTSRPIAVGGVSTGTSGDVTSGFGIQVISAAEGDTLTIATQASSVAGNVYSHQIGGGVGLPMSRLKIEFLQNIS